MNETNLTEIPDFEVESTVLNDFALNVAIIGINLLIQIFSGVNALNLRCLSHKKYKMTGYLGRGLLDTPASPYTYLRHLVSTLCLTTPAGGMCVYIDLRRDFLRYKQLPFT